MNSRNPEGLACDTYCVTVKQHEHPDELILGKRILTGMGLVDKNLIK
jgi:hypothetical protein